MHINDTRLKIDFSYEFCFWNLTLLCIFYCIFYFIFFCIFFCWYLSLFRKRFHVMVTSQKREIGIYMHFRWFYAHLNDLTSPNIQLTLPSGNRTRLVVSDCGFDSWADQLNILKSFSWDFNMRSRVTVLYTDYTFMSKEKCIHVGTGSFCICTIFRYLKWLTLIWKFRPYEKF